MDAGAVKVKCLSYSWFYRTPAESFFAAFLQNSIQEYLETLPKQTFDRLYTQPATCLAILRSVWEPSKPRKISYSFVHILDFFLR